MGVDHSHLDRDHNKQLTFRDRLSPVHPSVNNKINNNSAKVVSLVTHTHTNQLHQVVKIKPKTLGKDRRGLICQDTCQVELRFR